MPFLRTLAATLVLALAVSGPAAAQRGHGHGGGDGGSRPDAGAMRPQPKDSAAVVDRMINSGRATTLPDISFPTLPGLNSATLIAPRPGADAFRPNPGHPGWMTGPRAPAWGGSSVTSVPSWGGNSIYETDRGGRDGSSYRGRVYGGYGYGYGAVYGVPYGFLPYGTAQPVVPGQPGPTAQPEIPDGFLRLVVSPREAEVLIDGVVVGTVDDFGGRREQALPAGVHHVRIEAPEYEPVEFDVRVPAGDTISLRRELNRLPAPPRPSEPERTAPSAAPAVRKTFYAIPNCYLGDTIPKAESLPARCSVKDLRVLPPQ